MRHWILALMSLVCAVGATPARAQAAAEASCAAGKAEACFYTGADYAQGKGVPASKQKASEFFLLACDKGIPDGCYYSGLFHYKGEGDVAMNRPVAIDQFERACRMGHVDGCAYINSVLKNPEQQDIARLIPVLEAGCGRGATKACTLAAELLYDGRGGQYPGHTDWVRAAPLMEKSCADPANLVKGKNFYCLLVEDIYSRPQGKTFDAAKSLHYTRMNCDNGRAGSCSNMGRIYHSIEDWPLALAAYEQACKFDAAHTACANVTSLRQYMAEVATQEARSAERKAALNGLLGSGQYGAAVNQALHQFKSTDLAETAALAASRAGRMGDVATQDLYALAMWFPSGPVRAATDREMARRGTGLEGTFGTGTNSAGAADARWKAQNGSAASRPSASSSAGAGASRTPVLNWADAAAQTREKYRHVHCTMNNNANRSICR